ncbi:hypothetical protein [Frisingicoccus sp.]|uniref:hypothetical protein n=1 Tax=Frisingicoccus sp. TaxID=1918627 RepID=UPI003996B275
MEIQGFEKAGIVQSCLLLKCQGAKIGINRQPLSLCTDMARLFRLSDDIIVYAMMDFNIRLGRYF